MYACADFLQMIDFFHLVLIPPPPPLSVIVAMCTNKRFIQGIHLRGRVERSFLHGEGAGGGRRTGAEIQRALLAGIERVFR
jgi:hypothetical protein